MEDTTRIDAATTAKSRTTLRPLTCLAWLGALPAVCPGQAPSHWMTVRSPEVAGHAMVYDRARERLVVFGGSSTRGYTPYTWEWDGHAWLDRSAEGAPGGTNPNMMAYDSVRRCTVLSGTPAGETWEWDGTAWTQRLPATSPPVRSAGAMAYDPVRQRVVLFGGQVSSRGFADTWEWDGVTWTKMASLAVPRARWEHAMAFDPVRGCVVMVGGMIEGAATLGDVWEWDGRTWTPRNSRTHLPPRHQHRVAYDEARSRLVVVGGRNHPNTYWTTEVWEWDGADWAMHKSPSAPDSSHSFAMAYDVARRRIALFGGVSLRIQGGIWEWDGDSWRERFRPSTPPFRNGQAAVFDEVRAHVVMFGGRGDYGWLDDLWEWDGSGWLAIACRPSAWPPPRDHHSMAYDARRGRTVLFGGQGWSGDRGDTWEWDGVQWWCCNSPGPPPGADHAMAWDRRRQCVVLYGGSAGTGTWEWDGVAWTQRHPLHDPGFRGRPAMAYDDRRGCVVLFGGRDWVRGSLGDTWEWDGLDWILRAPQGSFTRNGAAMTFDPRLDRVVMYGGGGAGGGFQVLLAWDGSAWATVPSANYPENRTDPAMVYDRARDRLILHENRTTWLHGSLVASTIQAFGTPCGRSGSTPSLTTGIPYAGNRAFHLDLLTGPPTSGCLFGLASDTQALAIGGGCTLYLAGAITWQAGATNAAGFASKSAMIPAERSLRGMALYAQALALDVGGPGVALAASNASRIVIGD